MHSNSSVLLTSLPRAVIDHEAERASLARIQRQLYIILFTCETFSMDEKCHSVALFLVVLTLQAPSKFGLLFPSKIRLVHR